MAASRPIEKDEQAQCNHDFLKFSTDWAPHQNSELEVRVLVRRRFGPRLRDFGEPYTLKPKSTLESFVRTLPGKCQAFLWPVVEPRPCRGPLEARVCGTGTKAWKVSTRHSRPHFVTLHVPALFHAPVPAMRQARFAGRFLRSGQQNCSICRFHFLLFTIFTTGSSRFSVLATPNLGLKVRPSWVL